MERKSIVRIANVMSDPTRYGIYRFVLNSAEMVTVRQVANEFSIHPNVARLHLNKLEQAGLTTSDYRKPGRSGGRPAKTYGITEETVCLTFPPQDFELLSELLLEALTELGRGALEAVEQTGYARGKRAADDFLQRRRLGPDSSFEELAEGYRELLEQYSLQPEISRQTDECFVLHISYCTFRELMERYPGFVCSLHQQLLKGAADSFFGNVQFEELSSMSKGDSACAYSVQVTHKAGSRD